MELWPCQQLILLWIVIVQLKVKVAHGLTSSLIVGHSTSWISSKARGSISLSSIKSPTNIKGTLPFAEKPVKLWDHADSVSWIQSLPEDLGIDVAALTSESLTGQILLDALESTRELKDTFGLTTVEKRLRFEKCLKRELESRQTEIEPRLPDGSLGGIYDEKFLKTVSPLYEMHMGVENMGPLLYSLVRFTKPKRVLEVGAGYTSLFILQALKDNDNEIQNYIKLEKLGKCNVEGWPYCEYGYLDKYGNPGVLDCIDNMAHEFTTADKVLDSAKELGLSQYLRFQVEDAFEFHNKLSVDDEKEIPVDFAWVDFGAGPRLHEFFENYWDKISGHGGFILVHSTCTNNRTKTWLNEMKKIIHEVNSKYGGTEYLSLWEPHKYFQNSVTIFQKRMKGYEEPIHTEYP